MKEWFIAKAISGLVISVVTGVGIVSSLSSAVYADSPNVREAPKIVHVPLPWDHIEAEQELGRFAESFTGPLTVAEYGRMILGGKGHDLADLKLVPLPSDPMEAERELGRYIAPDAASPVNKPDNTFIPQPWDTAESELQLGLR